MGDARAESAYALLPDTDAHMNPRVKALGEMVLRVHDLQAVTRFYAGVIGLHVLQEFDGIAFLKVSDGYGGHSDHRAVPRGPARPVPQGSTEASFRWRRSHLFP
jgi:catechol 2,3-dioxygenase-like lactoylglutathione lyase family enzyme